jgi:hypothetical protein
MKEKKFFPSAILLMFVLSACGQPVLSTTAPPLKIPSVIPVTVTQTDSGQTATSSPVTDSSLVSEVIVTTTTSCRFGPDQAYVPRYRVGVGTFQVIGRDSSGNWLHVYPPGLKKSCWIETRFTLAPVDIAKIPVIPFYLEFKSKYEPPSNIKALRSDGQVQISWNDVVLQSEVLSKNRFLLELWLCTNDALTYTLRSTNDLTITVTDQPGCSEASHGQIFTATREGYSQPAAIPWPAP